MTVSVTSTAAPARAAILSRTGNRDAARRRGEVRSGANCSGAWGVGRSTPDVRRQTPNADVGGPSHTGPDASVNAAVTLARASRALARLRAPGSFRVQPREASWRRAERRD